VSPGTIALSDSELDVLRYQPASPTTSEITSELFVSANTVKTPVEPDAASLAAYK
jgi:hypothetical protein